jgi:iron complex outermembrane recepter protein
MRDVVSQRNGKRILRFLLTSLCLGIAGARAQEPQKANDLTQMSLEDLLNVQVTTASKKEQRLAETAAAVYVITAEDIARSGFTSIPEALRLAPGVDVAQISSSAWAIAIRGFNSRYSDKLLVLVDGRTVYSATFSQVLWNIQDLPLDDVERIEVIRGPGAVVWGANAVDGVINIITRSANDTQGGLLTAVGGSHDSALADLRYGWRTGPAAFRFSTQYVDSGTSTNLLSGESDHDRWDLQRASLRSDWSPSAGNGFLFEGDLDQSHASETIEQAILVPPYNEIINGPSIYSGGDLLFRWKHELAGGSETILQGFYDRNHQEYPAIGTTEDTFDIDFQQHLHLFKRHDVVWGAGARAIREQTRGTADFSFDPPNSTIKLFSAFLQDEIALLHGRVRLTVGSKLEHNDYSGTEVQPDVRLLWSPRPRHSVWMAVSRAVRSPSTLEEGAQVNLAGLPGPDGLAVVPAVTGNTHVGSEKLLAYQAGYRVQATPRLSFDLTSFYNRYSDLSSGTPAEPVLEGTTVPYLLVPIVLGNGSRAHSVGMEISAHYRVRRSWDLSGSYSWLRLRYELNPPYPSGIESFIAGASPENQFQVHSYFSLFRHLSLDTSLYWVSSLTGSPVAPNQADQAAIPSYSRWDVHLAWPLRENLQLSSGLQNLLDARHLEFGEDITPMVPTEIRRAFYGKVAWRF